MLTENPSTVCKWGNFVQWCYEINIVYLVYTKDDWTVNLIIYPVSSRINVRNGQCQGGPVHNLPNVLVN